MLQPQHTLLYVLLFLTTAPDISIAENAALPGEITQELPTLRCLGVRWLIAGDDNRNAKWGLTFNEGARITVKRCKVVDVDYAFVAGRNGQRQQRIFISDCVMRGRSTWPRTEGIEPRRGIQIGGTGHIIRYNRISHFADAIDTFSAYPTCAIDIYDAAAHPAADRLSRTNTADDLGF